MTTLLTWFVLVLVFKNTACQGYDEVVIEKGQSTLLQCNVTSNATSATWQLIDNGGNQVNISTCNFTANICTDHQVSSVYKGFISTTGSDRIVVLNVTSARTNETQFFCITDVEEGVLLMDLTVYAWPKKVTCSQFETNTYVDYTCTADNVFPDVSGTLYRRERDYMTYTYSNDYPDCSLGKYGKGTEGDYSGVCVWRIPMNRMHSLSHFYAEMAAHVSYRFNINKTAVISNGITTVLSLPQVSVVSYNCPAGPGVYKDMIDIGTSATCKCELIYEGFPPGFARWYTQSDDVVGVEDKKDKSSTVTISYNSSLRYQYYECRPFSPLFTKGRTLTYTPKFRSSAPPTFVTGLQPMILILGAVCFGIVFP